MQSLSSPHRLQQSGTGTWMGRSRAAGGLMATVLACATLSGAPREFYVATAGDDAGPGSVEHPFATLPRAMAAVRSLELKSTSDSPVTVILRGGTYALTEPLVFGPDDTGTETSPVTYRAFPEETPIISGGRHLTGPWTRAPGKPFYQTTIAAVKEGTWSFNSLTVKGQSRLRARTPNWNEKVLRAEGRAPGEDARQAFTYQPGDIDPTWTNLTDIDIVLLCSWTPTIHRIDEVVPERRVVRFHSSHSRTVDAWEKNFRYYLANVFEALDEPGEWYLNQHTGVLSYYPLPGEDMTTLDVVAPVLKGRLVTFKSDLADGRFIEYLHFVGLTFSDVDGDLDRYNGVYRQGHMFLDAAIGAQGLRHTTFQGCTISQVGEYAMELGTGCRNNRVEQCHIWDIGAGGVQLGISDLSQMLDEQNRVQPGDQVFEAEDAELTAPMVAGADSDASAGRYAWLPEGTSTGQMAFHFTVTEPGTYELLARVKSPSGETDSFTVHIDDGPRYTYDTGNHGSWTLSRIVARELEGKPLVTPLATGPHVVTVGGREAGTMMDQLIVRRQEDEAPAGADDHEVTVLDNVIDNTIIHRIGTIWHGCYGIVNRFASRSRITHNDISDTHWIAIGLDARWTYHGESYSHGNVVAYNHLHHLGLGYHADAAGIYQFGPLDTHIHHNHVHDTVAYPYICGYAGIYLDEQSRGALVENNLVYNTDWYAYFQHKGVDNTFRNNIGAFARDGFFLRGALNAQWKTNTFEVSHNIYISKDGVMIKDRWEPGLEPPVIRDNMYGCTDPNAAPTFAGKPLADWQALGNDLGSIIGDPGCRDPENLDFTLRPDAAALAAIGFVPFDDEIRKAGLYGDPAWMGLPTTFSRRSTTPAWSRDDLARFVAFSFDFEDMPDGYEPGLFALVKEGEATFAVSSAAARSGTKALRCVDRKGLRKGFYPYIHIAPKRLGKGHVTFAMDAMNSPEQPMHANLEFRGKGFTSDVGPSVHLNRDGTITANGTTVGRVPVGTWCRITIDLELGKDSPRTYALQLECDGQTTTHALPYTHASFSDISWLGITAIDDADGVMTFDNMSLRIE